MSAAAWVIVVELVLLAVVIIVLVQRSPLGEENEIGESRCLPMEPEDWQVDKSKPIRRGAIFVSVAAYRDDECKDTVYDLFEKAKSPDRIFVGVVQQNKKEKEDCFDRCAKCRARKESGHIRVKQYDYKEAKGPCYARYQCSKLWDGEEYYMQIDSHMKFEQDWDVTLMEEFVRCNDPKGIVGGYPPTDDQLKDMVKNGYSTMIHMCEPNINEDGLVGFKAGIIDAPKDGACVPQPFCGAGLMVMPYQALFDVPYDPYLCFLFFGEEILHCARLWTSGYNFYAVNKSFVSHHYSRPGKPKFWNDNRSYERCRQAAVKRAKYLLGLAPLEDVQEGFRTDLEKYGVGSARPLDEYWKYAGVDWEKKTAEKKCGAGKYALLR